MSGHVLDIWLTHCEGNHSSRKFSFPLEAWKMETADLVEGGFGAGYPVSLSLCSVSVLSVWNHLWFQLPWLWVGLERTHVTLQSLQLYPALAWLPLSSTFLWLRVSLFRRLFGSLKLRSWTRICSAIMNFSSVSEWVLDSTVEFEPGENRIYFGIYVTLKMFIVCS